MDDQLYFWQLKDIWVLIPKAELDREGEHQRDDSPSWVPACGLKDFFKEMLILIETFRYIIMNVHYS